MTELTIHGRGGQGGVTLAKLIATAYFLRGKHAQAFGVYAAERSGAPLQAYVRIDDEEITNHNQIRRPDHVIVLDRTLIGPAVRHGLKPGGWIILNTPDAPDAFAEWFAGYGVATIDATGIAQENGLGTRAVPIVNTTMLGAALRVFEMPLEQVEAALDDAKFGGANLVAARRAYDEVRCRRMEGVPASEAAASVKPAPVDLLDESVGAPPALRTGQWANRRPERRRLTPPCSHACPAGNDVHAFVGALGRGDANEALGILLSTSPLPGVCGRVCPAPCMDACNRHLFDEEVNIRELKRHAADHGRRPDPIEPWRTERVAVVGSGPAGLSAAYHLARLGYPVTLLEAGEELGGVLRTGIPEYRLPRDVLDAEIAFILAHGVTARTASPVDRGKLLTLSRAFDAIFVATGLQGAQSLQLPGGHPDVVMQGLEFLDRTRQHTIRLNGETIVVVGGGNTAIDAARSAWRVGARRVHILYRRTRNEMPAIAEEVDDALAEGIVLDELVMPLRLRQGADGPMLTCTRMHLGDPDESGRRAPTPETTEDAVFDVRCDRVILALGQGPDLSIWPEGSEVHEGNGFAGLTGAPIFAGGDFATNDGTVASAIGSGRRAAFHVHRTLTGEDLFPPPSEPIAEAQLIRTHVFTRSRREPARVLPVELRRHGFLEVRQGYAEEPGDHAAAHEARRCFSCGVCNACDRCRDHCPEGVLRRNGDGYAFDYDYCKGCGVCATCCPRGVIYMTEL